MILVCRGGKPCYASGIDFGERAIDLSLLLEIFNEMGNLPGGVWVAYLVGEFSFIGWIQVDTSQFLHICGSVDELLSYL